MYKIIVTDAKSGAEIINAESSLACILYDENGSITRGGVFGEHFSPLSAAGMINALGSAKKNIEACNPLIPILAKALAVSSADHETQAGETEKQEVAAE